MFHKGKNLKLWECNS